jgi:hypothetical protein
VAAGATKQVLLELGRVEEARDVAASGDDDAQRSPLAPGKRDLTE